MKFLLYFSAVMALAYGELSRELAAGNTAFTAKMFNELVKSNPGKSVVQSALSVLTPLAQLSLASEGETHDELLNAIGLPNDNVTRAAFPSLNSNLRSVKGVTLKTASRIYIPTGYELSKSFAEDSKSVFDSEVKNVDFTKSVETAKEINTWVEEQTNNRIKDLVSKDSLNADTRAVLVNAIYFKGSWKNKFIEAATIDRPFHVSKDKTIQVPTMYQKAEFKYSESEELDAKLLEMPYEGEETSFLVILPNKVDGLADLEEKLKDTSVLENAVKNMFPVEVEVYIPKFKIETTINLKDVLQKIGVNKIFDPTGAQFTRLLNTNEQMYVSEAIQKAFIEISEEGAEAAAANEFGIAYLSAAIPSIVFDANHPFVFSLQEGDNTIFDGVYYG